MAKITVTVKNQNNAIPSDVILETASMREAVETAFSAAGECSEYESVFVNDEKSAGWLVDFRMAMIAMNKFYLVADVRHGKKVSNGCIEFQALGKIETTNERNELWERMNHIRYGDYEN